MLNRIVSSSATYPQFFARETLPVPLLRRFRRPALSGHATAQVSGMGTVRRSSGTRLMLVVVTDRPARLAFAIQRKCTRDKGFRQCPKSETYFQEKAIPLLLAGGVVASSRPGG